MTQIYVTLSLTKDLCLFVGNLISVNNQKRAALCLYLEDVTLCKLKGAGSDVDTFACLHLNAVHTFVAIVIVHWIVW